MSPPTGVLRRVRTTSLGIAVLLLSVVSVQAALTVSATASQESWVPSNAPLPSSNLPDGMPAESMQLDDTSCSSSNFCVAVGYVSSQSDPSESGISPNYAFAETYTDGVWTPQVLPEPANALEGAFADAVLTSVSCAVDGSCAAVGVYYTQPNSDGISDQVGLLEQLSGGTWIATGADGAVGSIGNANLYSVSCSDATTCVAVGNDSTDNGPEGVIYELAAGTWTTLLSPAPANPWEYELNSVSCPVDGTCVAVGETQNEDYVWSPLIVTLTSGVWRWSTAPSPANIIVPTDSGTPISLNSIDCPDVGSCTVAGSYGDSAGHIDPEILTLSDGAWTAIEAPVPSEATYGLPATLTGMFCPELGSCFATGNYSTIGNVLDYGMILTESNGTWSAMTAPLPSSDEGPDRALNESPSDTSSSVDSTLAGLSCGTGGLCEAAGTDGTSGLIETATVSSLPTVTSVSPDEGPIKGGTTVVISGSNFAPGSTVAFGPANAVVVSESRTQIRVESPRVSAAQLVNVVVKSPAGGSRANSRDSFAYIGSQQHTAGYTLAPKGSSAQSVHVGFLIPQVSCGSVPNGQGLQEILEGVTIAGATSTTSASVLAECNPTPNYVVSLIVNGRDVTSHLLPWPGRAVTITVSVSSSETRVSMTIAGVTQTATSSGGKVVSEVVGAMSVGCNATSCVPVPKFTPVTLTNVTFNGKSPAAIHATLSSLDDAAGHVQVAASVLRVTAAKLTWKHSCGTEGVC